MTISTAVNDSQAKIVIPKHISRWSHLATYVVALGLLALALYLRLHNLGLLYDRDGYDEGVYWQSLRAMSAGHSLYDQIFYSQPPFFLLSAFPIYTLFGQTLWAARLAMALLSLFGFVGAFFLGKALVGRVGALLALLLLTIDPLYLAQSQTLQAEAPSTALALLAVGLAYYWTLNPAGIQGTLLVVFCAIALALSIASKLLGIAAVVPIVLLLVLQYVQTRRSGTKEQLRGLIRSLLFGVIAFVLTLFILLLPFLHAFPQLWSGVVTFHTDAGRLLKEKQSANFTTMSGLLTSIIAAAALLGMLLALFRKDWRVLPLIAWLLATLVMLWMQIPLFHHHLVALIPPLIGLAVIGLSPSQWQSLRPLTPLKLASLLSIVLLLLTVGLNAWGTKTYYEDKRHASISGLNKNLVSVATDLRNATRPDQLVITDAQFIVAAADRNTPADLVDTSIVRTDTEYVTLSQLITAGSRPEVHAVLFYSGRLNREKLRLFHAWVAQHFTLTKNYGAGRELWTRV